MQKLLLTTVAFVLAGFLAPSISLAGLQSPAKGVYTDDFKDGTLNGWELSDPNAVGADVTPANEPYVKLGPEGGLARMWVKDRVFEDFEIEVKLRRQYGQTSMGVFFDDNSQVIFVLEGGLQMSTPGKSMRELLRARDLDKWTTLKVVVAGKVATAYVDGNFAAQLTDIKRTPGKLGVTAGQPSYLSSVKITEGAKPERYLGFLPIAEGNALVFDPGKDVSIRVRISNTHARPQSVSVKLVVDDWQGKQLAASKPVSIEVPGNTNIEQSIPVGKFDEGYYRVTLEPIGMTFPLAIQERPDPAKTKRPEIWPGREGGDLAFGVYWYLPHSTAPDPWKNTYAHAAARNLRKHNFNSMFCIVGMPADQVEIFASYGIACLSRGGYLMDHPLLAGTLIGDEPKGEEIQKYKEDYQALRDKYAVGDRAITSCMIGDNGVAGLKEAWDTLLPLGGVRLFRWYGIKYEHFGVLFPPAKITFSETMRQARDGYLADGYPYWVILPSLGGRGATAYYGEAAPSEISAMMHLAAAYQAKGFFFYTYQSMAVNSPGLVQDVSLLPSDGRWPMAGKVAEMLSRNAKILAALKPTNERLWYNNPLVEVLTYVSNTNENHYIYLVNKDFRKPGDIKLFQLAEGAEYQDLYSGRKLTAKTETYELKLGTKIETAAINLTLEPGEGALLCYQSAVKSERSEPVKFPDEIAKAPADRIVFLEDLEPVNKPQPGWVARDVMGIKKLTLQQMWRTYCGKQTLFKGMNDIGVEYPKCIYAHADCRVEYDLPADCKYFAAAAGFGAKQAKASVVFRVYVDGQKKFDSGLVRLADGPQPVVVDISGAKKLALVTGAADFSISHDYAFWGAARLIKK